MMAKSKVSIRSPSLQSLSGPPWSVSTPVALQMGSRYSALPARLVQEDRGADRDIQAVRRAEHRDSHGLDTVAAPGVRQARGLCAHDQRQRAGQVRLEVAPIGIDSSR